MGKCRGGILSGGILSVGKLSSGKMSGWEDIGWEIVGTPLIQTDFSVPWDYELTDVHCISSDIPKDQHFK